jgi:hypothetical protein
MGIMVAFRQGLGTPLAGALPKSYTDCLIPSSFPISLCRYFLGHLLVDRHPSLDHSDQRRWEQACHALNDTPIAL